MRDEKLSAIELAVNNAWQNSTESTPFILSLGEWPQTPTAIALNCKIPAGKKVANLPGVVQVTKTSRGQIPT